MRVALCIVTAMESFVAVIALWPQPSDLAGDIGQDAVTVRSWKARNSIPAEYWPAIVQAAARREFEGLTLEFLATLVKPRKKHAGAPQREDEAAA